MSDASLGGALTTLVQLLQLTSLEFQGEWPSDRDEDGARWPKIALVSPVSRALQQLLDQPLPLRSLLLPEFVKDFGVYQLPVLNMAQLTNLTELSTGRGELVGGNALPTQLQRLLIQSSPGAHSIAPLTRLEPKQLQHLSLRVDFQQPQLLLQLAQLPALTHLALLHDEGHCTGQPAAATASAWQMLPQLRELDIRHGVPPSQAQWQAVLAGAAAAASLTKLALDAPMNMRDESGEESSLESSDASDGRSEEKVSLESDEDAGDRWALKVAACASLAKLTRLKDLTIRGNVDYELNLLRGDALALTTLTRLTRLDLSLTHHGVGTAVATAVARSLQRLQDLDFCHCCLQLGGAEGLACLEAIGSLTQLTSLRLGGNEVLTQHGLMQLTGLSRLDQAVCDLIIIIIKLPN
jgi:hypothetical protein